MQPLVVTDGMHPAGLAEVERARVDGRWATAYEGSKAIEVPADFAAALLANPRAGDVRATPSPESLRDAVSNRDGEAQ